MSDHTAHKREAKAIKKQPWNPPAGSSLPEPLGINHQNTRFQKNMQHAMVAQAPEIVLSVANSANIACFGETIRSAPEARDWNGVAIFDVPNPSEFTMVVTADHQFTFMVGIALADADVQQPHLFRSCGYYIFAGKSELHGQDGTRGRQNPHLGNSPARKIRMHFEAEPRPLLSCSTNDGPLEPLSFDRPIPMGEWRPAVLFDRGGILVSMVIHGSNKTRKAEAAISAKLWDDYRRPYSDAIITAKGGKKFYVHRNVLAAASPLFKKQFEDLERKKEEAQIDFAEEPGVVECVLRHCYNGFGPDSDAVSVIPVAFRYGLAGLVEMCGQSVVTSLTAQNAAGAVTALRLVKDQPAMAKVWDDVERKIRNDPDIMSALMNKVEIR